MATLIEKNLPYKIYSATNMGSNEGMFYLGKVPNNLNFNQKVYSDAYYQNCFSGYYFSIASLVPGSCVRMDPADESDTNILIDAKWYDFRPACTMLTCNETLWPNDNVLYSVDYTNPMTVTPAFKSFVTDGSVVISGLESSFFWNDEGIHNAQDESHCTIYLQAWKYKFENACPTLTSGAGPYYGMIGTPGESDVIFLMKSLVGGQNMFVTDTGTALKIAYINSDCRHINVMPPPITCEPYIPSNIGTFI